MTKILLLDSTALCQPPQKKKKKRLNELKGIDVAWRFCVPKLYTYAQHTCINLSRRSYIIDNIMYIRAPFGLGVENFITFITYGPWELYLSNRPHDIIMCSVDYQLLHYFYFNYFGLKTI